MFVEKYADQQPQNALKLVYGIANKLRLKEYARQSARRTTQLKESHLTTEDSDPTEQDYEDAELLTAIRKNQMLSVIETRLGTRHRQYFQSYVFSYVTQEEIARTYNTNRQAVNRLVNEAFRLLEDTYLLDVKRLSRQLKRRNKKR